MHEIVAHRRHFFISPVPENVNPAFKQVFTSYGRDGILPDITIALEISAFFFLEALVIYVDLDYHFFSYFSPIKM